MPFFYQKVAILRSFEAVLKIDLGCSNFFQPNLCTWMWEKMVWATSAMVFITATQNRTACGRFLSRFQPLKMEEIVTFRKTIDFQNFHLGCSNGVDLAAATVLTFLESSCLGDTGACLEFGHIWPEGWDIGRQSWIIWPKKGHFLKIELFCLKR